jgi:antitoxin component YwqK of YwqJK toxin-antitoxin module
MKRIGTLLFLILCAFGVTISQTLEEKERELFKQYKVKERTTINYSYINGKKSDQGIKTSTSTYNTEGLVLSTKTFDRNGEITTSEKFGYDVHNNRILYERKGKRSYMKTSEYNEADNIILESGYDGSSAFKTVYNYNNSGRLAEIKYYAENLLDEKRVYLHSENKAVVRVLHRGKDLKSTIGLVFNSNGDILEEVTQSLEGVELDRRKMTYNEAGFIATEEKYRAGNLSYKLTYQYDDNNNLIKLTEESPSKGKLDKKLYKYDSAGRIIEYKWKRKPDEEYNVKTYKYGSEGVCIEEFTRYPKTNYQLLSTYEYKFY